MENNESGCAQSPEEAAALQISLHQGPARPPLPMRHFRPAKEPSLKPSGGGVFSLVTEFSFHRLKLTATPLGPSCQGHIEFAPLRPPSCPALTLGTGKQRPRKQHLLALRTGLSSLTSLCSRFFSVKWG